MEKKKLGVFIFFRSLVQFLKIVTMFFVMLHLLYWIQHLIGSFWNWMNFAHPILDFFIDLGAEISKDSLSIFNAEFEYKYMIALVMYLCIYYSLNLIIMLINEIEYHFNNVKRFAKKVNENNFNASLDRRQYEEESRINKYMIYVKPQLKSRFSDESFGYKLSELTYEMNKFIINKTEIQPIEYENGFLYTFNNFEAIDSILNIFMKIINSDSPLDYIVCAQITEHNRASDLVKLKYLIDLNMANKIIMLSETAYRYKFNKNKKYKTIQQGLFQKDTGTIEIQSFAPINE